MFLKSTSFLIATRIFHCILVAIFSINTLTSISQTAPKKFNYPVNGIRLYKSIPSVSVKGQLSKVQDSISIYYYKNFIMYEIYVTKIDTKNIYNKSGIKIGQNDAESIILKYFIYKKGDRNGVYYDSVSNKITGKSSVDSFLMNTCSKYPNWFDTKYYKLMSSNNGNKHFSIIEKYAIKNKIDQSYCDTIYFYYSSKINSVDYSFSEPTDFKKKMKLVKFAFINNPFFSKEYHMAIPRRELSFELKEFSVYKPKTIISLINRLASAL